MRKEEKIIWEKGGSEMVLIPSGSFEMGDHFDGGDDDELPIHEVELDALYGCLSSDSGAVQAVYRR